MCLHFQQQKQNKGTYIHIFGSLLEIHVSRSVAMISFLFVHYVFCPLQLSERCS